MLYNKAEFDKLKFAEAVEYFRNCEQSSIDYQTKYKSEMVLGMAEKLKVAQYPILEIKERILETVGDLVSTRYVDKCLTDEYKPRKTNKQIATIAAGGSTVLEPVTRKTDREELSSTTPSIANNDTNLQSYESEPVNDIQRPTLEYVSELEQQILALNGDLPYTDMKATHRIMKLSKSVLQQLINTSKTCSKFVQVEIDIRTQEIDKVTSDKALKKTKENIKTEKQKNKKSK